jgi:hypothetical protein
MTFLIILSGKSKYINFNDVKTYSKSLSQHNRSINFKDLIFTLGHYLFYLF